ncbi:MAG: hypothetical protein QNJ46_35205 [Leptolyngbyaceae cyanobacterium MO_188.B28]|nr:hypothetical protein [Leptolyngbyaceae cyanobacterium MO_188.B28]
MTETKVGLRGAIGATFSNIFKQRLNLPSEEDLIEEEYETRDNTLIAVRFLLTLVMVTLVSQQVSKKIIVRPIIDHLRGNDISEIFINAEMKEEAFNELRFYEQSLRFDGLLDDDLVLSQEEKEAKLALKAAELSEEYREESQNALGNRFADLIAVAICFLMTKIYGDEMYAVSQLWRTLLRTMSDSAKAFVLILSTDIFVGFHSAHGWEVALDWLAHHLGVAADHALIFLFIATVPVILDTIIKYGIFQSDQLSSSTVASFKEMNH